MNYCSQCGASVIIKTPEGDERPRYVCESCETIHYQNPKIVVGVLPTWQDKILFCRRAIQPRHGLWTLPAGFMENGETLEQGACRETYEEANAIVSNATLYTVISLPHISQVYMMYRGEIENGQHSPGIESLETRLLAVDEIPWDELAFRTIKKTLQCFVDDKASGNYPVHHLTIVPEDT